MLQAAVIFHSGMILQRGKCLAVWGTGNPGETIGVQIQGRTGQTVTEADGTWSVDLPPLDASVSEELIIKSDSHKIIFEQVAVGEVWVAGGQSNMEFLMRYEKHKKEEVKDCTDPDIRFYDVPEVCYDGQLEEFDYSRQGIWRKANPENLDYFSAVGYYFQKALKEKLNVPVGIIGCNWGGTASCSWMNPETVRKVGEPWMQEYETRTASMDMEEYWENQHGNQMNDKGNPFADVFGEFMMPRTPTEEELVEFFSHIKDNFEEYANILQPQAIPGSLYEHMLKSIVPYTIKGFLWYQGESDDVPGLNVLYKDMLSGLISDWRRLWGDEALPFLIVQLPGYDCWLMNTEENHYPIIRRCQEAVADSVEHTYLCSISDVGEEKDIHPKDKKTVGQRLALLARGHVYGEEILCDAPRAVSIKRNADGVAVTFEHAEGGLEIKGGHLNALQIISEGTEQEYSVYTEGDQLIIRMGNPLEEGVSVKFAQTPWYQVNLYNKAGIPAVPFEFSL